MYYNHITSPGMQMHKSKNNKHLSRRDSMFVYIRIKDITKMRTTMARFIFGKLCAGDNLSQNIKSKTGYIALWNPQSNQVITFKVSYATSSPYCYVETVR